MRIARDDPAAVNATNNLGTTALHLAAARGDVRMAMALLQVHAPVDAREGESLGHAAALASGVEGYTPLHYAARGCHTDCALLLLEAGADPELPARDGSTALHMCARHGANALARAMVARGVDVYAVDKSGLTASAWAEMVGNQEFLGIVGVAPPTAPAIEEVTAQIAQRQNQAILFGAPKAGTKKTKGKKSKPKK